MMEFIYKCPICRAKNRVSKANLICRRCNADLSEIYKIKKLRIKKLFTKIMKKGGSDENFE